jgi:hypothetical protein
MADINELQIPEDEAVVETFDDLPSQFGSWVRPLQPGTYVFTLPPVDVLSKSYETYDTVENGTPVRRVKVNFKGASRLRVLGNEEGYETSLTTKRVNRGGGVLVSDFTYLLQALGHSEPISGQKAYAIALNAHGSESFQADVNWRAACDKTRNAYVEVPDGNGGTETKKSDTKIGCGAEFRTTAGVNKQGKAWGAIPREEGKLVERFPCACGAVLRAFTSLQNYQPRQ